MTHVFIVNEQTMKIHLKYLFAGTGSSKDAPFLLDAEYVNSRKKEEGVTSAAERNLVAMIADVSRIRIGDKIIFYLQASKNNPGMFFGIFEAASEAFYQPNSNDYLTEELGKSLNFRVLIRPHKVYPKGISEHEALDSLVCVQHPSDMCWSLIYRKLKGNRGCTMITDNESRRLEILLSAKNNDEYLESNFFSFENNEIVASDVERIYAGQGNDLDILPRLLYKDRKNNKCESHLQAYVVQNIDKEPLKPLLLENIDNLWIGNEVSCGVGMQRIDVATMQITEESVIINVIELKCVEAYNEIIDNQIPWYIEWIRNYILPTFPRKVVIINPVIIAKEFKVQHTLQLFKDHCETLFRANARNFKVNPVSLITYETENNDISFKKEF